MCVRCRDLCDLSPSLPLSLSPSRPLALSPSIPRPLILSRPPPTFPLPSPPAPLRGVQAYDVANSSLSDCQKLRVTAPDERRAEVPAPYRVPMCGYLTGHIHTNCLGLLPRPTRPVPTYWDERD
eukprot:2102378-Rhodomonas_salina.1